MTMLNTKLLGLLGIVLCAGSVLADDVLLSRNATYRVVGEAHLGVYGEIVWVWPGTNIRPDESGWLNNPLVEKTDSGDVLIDGRTDQSSLLYTPGNWTGLGKRINVEMKLPGPARISRVVAHLPAGRLYRTQKATLYIMDSDGLWQQVAEISKVDQKNRKLTFTLAQVETGQVRLSLFNETAPRVGLSEIEVWGVGPTASNTRGLIRMPQHLDAVRPPQPQNVTASSVLLTKTTTSIKLSGTPLTSGNAALLVDGDRSTQIRIDGKPEQQYADRVVEIEIDLGVDSYIDSVRIWMPGGKGFDSGHVHDFMLAVSAGKEGNIWMVPGKRTTNHYWPGDDAPVPYVVPINKVNLIGRRLRLTATLAARGALTYRLAMAEIEVWGRPIPNAIKTNVRLDQRPIEITPEPVDIEQMHPQLRWMVEERIRCAWLSGDAFAKVQGDDRTAAQVFADAGFNVVATHMRPDRPGDTWATGTLGKALSTSHDIEQRLAPNVAAAKQAGLRFFVAWAYGSHHQDPYRRYRGLTTGRMSKMTTCPLDEEYIERHIGRWARAAAQGGADGFLIDNEMYESDDANYNAGPCICDDCFKTYVKTFSEHWRFIYERLSDDARGVWLQANRADEHYARFSASRIEALYDKIKRSCEQINPIFIMAKYHVFDDMPGLERGLGSTRIPAPLLSATEYTNGPNAWGAKLYRRARAEDYPLLYVCGAYVTAQQPETLSHSALLGSLYYGGWFLWHGGFLLNHTAADDPQGGRFPGTSAKDYLDRITSMHERLDDLLKRPRSEWPDPPPLIQR